MRKLIEIHQLTKDMSCAMAMKKLKVYLQPQFSLKEGSVTGAEAVLKWTHPEYGPITPEILIPLIDNTVLIAEMDRYILNEVFSMLGKWEDNGVDMFPVSVNVSRTSMNSSTLIPFINSLIKKHKAEASYLRLELSRSAYDDATPVIIKNIRQIQKLGIKVVFKDFGNGSSSMSALRDLPVDMIKMNIDMVPSNDKGTRGRIILFSLINMCKLLEVPIIVNGVEKKEQAELLMNSGCDMVQGTYYSKPLKVSDYENFVRSCQIRLALSKA